MSKIKNGGLDQYGAGLFEQQQFGTAGVEGVDPFIADNRLYAQRGPNVTNPICSWSGSRHGRRSHKSWGT